MVKNTYGLICTVGGKAKGNQDSAFYHEFDMIFAPGSPDAQQFSNKGILAIVCDGVSASNHGEKGSTFVARNLGAKIINSLILDDFELGKIQPMILNSIQQTNTELLNKYKDLITQNKVPKTTLVGVLIIGQYLWVFNLGDSRAFLLKDEEIGQISTDHIGTSAAHEITQAMGQEEISPAFHFYNWAFEKNLNITQKDLVYKENYQCLICSDGLTDLVSNNEIKLMLNNPNMEKMQSKVEELYKLTMSRKIDDNVSIIAIDLDKYFKSQEHIDILQLHQTN